MFDSAPKSLEEHFDAVWLVLVVVAGALYLSWKFILVAYRQRIEVLETNQKKVLSVIPKDALEHGRQLRTVEECMQARASCTNTIMMEELTGTLQVVKKALTVLVLHTDNIPQDERDRIVKDLIE